MRKTKLFFILISIFFVLQNIGANNAADSIQPVKVKPKFIYKIDNLTYFDNRMFYLPYHKSKMYLGDRLTTLAGIGLNKEGEHKLYAGVTAIVPFGTDFKEYKFQPMVYYKFERDFFCKDCFFEKQQLKLHFGILPYREMIMAMPGFIRRGSAEYTVPNLQGALAQYALSADEGDILMFFEYAVDWRKIKTKTQRDNFGMILDGKFRFLTTPEGDEMFNLGFITQWDRLGHNLDSIKNNVDNIVMNVFAKIDFNLFYYMTSHHGNTFFKTIYLQLGYLGSFSNDNNFVNKKWNNSLVIDCGIQWKMISLKNSLYISLNKEKDGNLMPLHQYYPELYISDQFYRAPLYNKTELAFDLLNIKSIFALKAQFVMHYVPKSVFDYLPDNKNFKQFGWQQKITAQVKF